MNARCLVLPFVLLVTSLAPLSRAEIQHHFSGFATLGLAFNNSPTLVFRRDVTQRDGALKDNASWKTDSLLGLQWQGRWSPQWETTIQLVAKDRVDNSLEYSIEWAFIGYRPMEGLNLRLGRLGADVFMLSEYRQVGYAFPWVRPPHDMYGIASLYSFDGLDLTKRLTFGDAMLDLKGFYGNSSEKYPTGYNTNESTAFNFDLYGGSAKLEWGDWKLRYTFIEVEVNSDGSGPLRQALQQASPLWPDARVWIPLLETRGRRFDYRQIALSYDNNDWWFHSEFLDLDSDVPLVSSGTHAYASLGKRIGAFNLYVLAGYADPDTSAVNIQMPSGIPEPYAGQIAQLQTATERMLNGVRIQQQSIGIGVRWDLAAKTALKLQAERFDIDEEGSNLWFRTHPAVPLAEDQKPTVISLALDVLF